MLNSGKWDRFLEFPKISDTDKRGNPIRNIIVPILLDLDLKKVSIYERGIKSFDPERDPEDFLFLKVRGGNNKAIYATCPPAKVVQIYKTFWGKVENNLTIEGELSESLRKATNGYLGSETEKALNQIFLLKGEFIELTGGEENEKPGQKIIQNLRLGQGENVVFLTIFLKGAEFGISTPSPFAKYPPYRQYLSELFFPEENGNQSGSVDELCYASGSKESDSGGLNLERRYSLNKMFVTETRNYAEGFGNDFRSNYQVSLKNQEMLDYGSVFLLDQMKTDIAGIPHVILPQFLESKKPNFSIVFDRMKKDADFLFSTKDWKEFAEDTGEEIGGVFWLNFLSFDSDGNYFKTTGSIKDVSHFYFEKVIETFKKVHWEFADDSVVGPNWDQAMHGKAFNMASLYPLIPLRKGKELKNQALALMKSILEGRTIDRSVIFRHFRNLILCHYYRRHKAYSNVRDFGNDYFYFAVRDSVLKYLALFKILAKLNLMDMKTAENPQMENEEELNSFDSEIRAFFEKMSFSTGQKALFYLGRILSKVTYLQRDKSKTVIEKVNFNGMDRDDILRLRIDLFEKAKQYSEINKIIFDDARFASLFDFHGWNMPTDEAIFFLLSGYSWSAKNPTASN